MQAESRARCPYDEPAFRGQGNETGLVAAHQHRSNRRGSLDANGRGTLTFWMISDFVFLAMFCSEFARNVRRSRVIRDAKMREKPVTERGPKTSNASGVIHYHR